MSPRRDGRLLWRNREVCWDRSSSIIGKVHEEGDGLTRPCSRVGVGGMTSFSRGNPSKATVLAVQRWFFVGVEYARQQFRNQQ